MLRLLGDVDGRRVLDAGCGAGALAAELVERGAEVVGVDRSAGLLEIAAERLAGRARLERADLGEPLPFAAASFDLIAASLVMHYLEDWVPTLRECRRVLVPGGRLAISTPHPFLDHALAGGEDYFATYRFEEEWERGDRVVRMSFWHRPLRAMTALAAASSRPCAEPRDAASRLSCGRDLGRDLVVGGNHVVVARGHGRIALHAHLQLLTRLTTVRSSFVCLWHTNDERSADEPRWGVYPCPNKRANDRRPGPRAFLIPHPGGGNRESAR